MSEQNTEQRSLFVAIVGRPSSGKSTLLNHLCGQKISIVSPVPQTTRNAVRGILTQGESQIVFIDTPGYHLSEKKLNKKLGQVTKATLNDSELIIYLIDACRPPEAEEQALANLLKAESNKILVVINKIDSARADVALAREFISEYFPSAPVIEISALKKTHLEFLKNALLDRAKTGPQWYPKEYYTDQEPSFRMAEIIREKIINLTRDEVPHSIHVELDATRELKSGDREVSMSIIVERESQKAIVIGKGGAVLKKIREQSLRDFAEIFDYRIELRLTVRVEKDWRHNDKKLAKIIF